MAESKNLISADLKADPLPVLVVSSQHEDHELFSVFLGGAGYSLHHALTLAEAVTILQQCPVRVVVTERTLPDGCWVDVHPPVESSMNPPLVIVFSDPEDASSWAHAFNVGAFDVLYRPLVAKVVEGSVTLASARWSRMAELSSARDRNMMASTSHRLQGSGRQRRGVSRTTKGRAAGAA